ncbi:MAG: gamma-glutamyltransferase, partial [Planctomycetaceae bacterium]
MADRDEFYGDPEFVKVPLKRLLSTGYARMRRRLIDPARASLQRRPGDPLAGRPTLGAAYASRRSYTIPVQDTTTCLAADRFGNVVAATPSCNLVGNQPGPSGVTQGNRIRSLNTTPGHPNRVQAGKRPRITLTPTLVTRGGKPVIAISVAGGDLQDQVTLNLLLNHIDFGLKPHEAVVVPRFITGHHQGSFDPNPDRRAAFISPAGLTLHKDVPEPIREQLAGRGHKLRVVGGPLAHPVMLVIDPGSGVVRGAGDPRVGRRVGVLDPLP